MPANLENSAVATELAKVSFHSNPKEGKDGELEIEENNRMGKTRDLLKIRHTKGTFHAKMGSIKDRNSMDLTEAENIKRWQEYKELYQERS